MVFRNRVAIITGASSGIGKEVAIDLARQGAVCVCASRSAVRLKAVLDEVQRFSPQSRSIVCDVGRYEQVSSMVRESQVAYGRIDILVNNAGFGQYRSFLDTPLSYMEEVMRVNYFGAFTA